MSFQSHESPETSNIWKNEEDKRTIDSKNFFLSDTLILGPLGNSSSYQAPSPTERVRTPTGLGPIGNSRTPPPSSSGPISWNNPIAVQDFTPQQPSWTQFSRNSPRSSRELKNPWHSPRPLNHQLMKKGNVIRKTFGLLDRNKLTPIPLYKVLIDGQIIGPFSRMTVTQYYQNTEPTSIEVEYVFPLAKYATVCDFSAEIDGQVISSKIVEDSPTTFANLLSPLQWPSLEDSNQNIFKVPLGTVPPNGLVMVQITYVGELLLRENELTFNISCLLFPPSLSEFPMRHTWEPRRPTYTVGMQLHLTMPIPIDNVHSSHPTQKTFSHNNTTVVVKLEEGASFESDFDMCIRLTAPHSPQIYLETGSDKQVAAFVLRPDFVGVNLFPDNTAFSEMIMNWGSLNVEQVPKTLRPISNMGCIIVYAVLHDVIISKEEISLKAITATGIITYKATLNPLLSFEGNLLHQLVARRKVRELERLNLQQFSPEKKQSIIQLSLEHNITSQYTSFLLSKGPVRGFMDSPNFEESSDVPRSSNTFFQTLRSQNKEEEEENTITEDKESLKSHSTESETEKGKESNGKEKKGSNHQDTKSHATQDAKEAKGQDAKGNNKEAMDPEIPISHSVDIRPKGTRAHDNHNANRVMSPTMSPNGWKTNSGGIRHGNYYSPRPHYEDKPSNSMFSNPLLQFKPSSPVFTPQTKQPPQDTHYNGMLDLNNGMESLHLKDTYEYGAPKNVKSLIESILVLQRPSGVWSLRPEICQFLGYSAETLRDYAGNPENVDDLVTAFVVVWLETFYPQFQSIWFPYVQRAKTFFDCRDSSDNSPQDWIRYVSMVLPSDPPSYSRTNDYSSSYSKPDYSSSYSKSDYGYYPKFTDYSSYSKSNDYSGYSKSNDYSTYSKSNDYSGYSKPNDYSYSKLNDYSGYSSGYSKPSDYSNLSKSDYNIPYSKSNDYFGYPKSNDSNLAKSDYNPTH